MTRPLNGPARFALIGALLLACPTRALAMEDLPPESYDPETLPDEEVLPDEDPAMVIPAIQVKLTPEEIAKAGGSVQQLDEQALEALEHDDPESILLQIPGVYVRPEDGFGLRPNIGMRGANSDRSKKITLMEDGVLFGPAPYAAPAAYYFPLMTRMSAVEVYKGPAALLFGPQTIGGAINLVTRAAPVMSQEGKLDVSVGSYPSGKAHLHYGMGRAWGGFVAEGVHLESAGFKELDGGGDTGFSRSEMMLKGHLNSSLEGDSFHLLEAKLGLSRERSHETYLGLSEADFAQSPDRRYRASALDLMQYWRTQAQLRYRFELGERFDLTATAYRHDLSRSWDKLNRFGDGTDAASVLANPTSNRNQIYYSVLTGAEDSTDATRLAIGDNARTFVSQGIQTVARHRHNAPSWSNQLEAGVRLHYDQIRREHDERLYDMIDGRLSRADTPRQITADNQGSALALAAHVVDQLSFWRLTLTPGVRVEVIRMWFEDFIQDTSSQSDQHAILPGVGAALELVGPLKLIAGVHRGFSPTSPGQPEEILPELSVNYEAGLRFDALSGPNLELIGFASDYSNLIGECSFAAGCVLDDINRQFNGGEALIYGVEALAAHTFTPSSRVQVPVRATYTYTQTEFKTAFSSENPQFGVVRPGDALPYVPLHQANVQLGARFDELVSGTLSVTYVGVMRERAGQGAPQPGDLTDDYAMLDLLVSYFPFKAGEVYLKVDNMLNTRPVVSRRPYGARPPRALLAQLGFKYSF